MGTFSRRPFKGKAFAGPLPCSEINDPLSAMFAVSLDTRI